MPAALALAAPGAPARPSEYRATLALAWPLVLTNLTQTGLANAAVVALAVSFLHFAALFAVADGAQAVGLGLLARGRGPTAASA